MFPQCYFDVFMLKVCKRSSINTTEIRVQSVFMALIVAQLEIHSFNFSCNTTFNRFSHRLRDLVFVTSVFVSFNEFMSFMHL